MYIMSLSLTHSLLFMNIDLDILFMPKCAHFLADNANRLLFLRRQTSSLLDFVCPPAFVRAFNRPLSDH